MQSTSVSKRNKAPNAPISYPNDLSEAIKTGIQNNSRLLITGKENDPQVVIEGTISSYTITPVALQQGDNAQSNRLTVSVEFTIYYSCKEETLEDEVTMTSTRFVDDDSDQDISAVETQLLSDINAQIVQDVLNKLFSNW